MDGADCNDQAQDYAVAEPLPGDAFIESVNLTGRADIGGFGAGSELSWQINAGLGCHVTRNLYSEMTYRIYDVNYRHGGLTDDVLTHGFELSAGITF